MIRLKRDIGPEENGSTREVKSKYNKKIHSDKVEKILIEITWWERDHFLMHSDFLRR